MSTTKRCWPNGSPQTHCCWKRPRARSCSTRACADRSRGISIDQDELPTRPLGVVTHPVAGDAGLVVDLSGFEGSALALEDFSWDGSSSGAFAAFVGQLLAFGAEVGDEDCLLCHGASTSPAGRAAYRRCRR